MQNKKVVVLGGGTGMSTLLKGLKLFPLDITAVVSVYDDGKISKEIKEKYETLEQKDEVIFDKENLEKMNLEIISNDYVDISDEIIRHKIDKLSLDIFAFLIR